MNGNRAEQLDQLLKESNEYLDIATMLESKRVETGLNIDNAYKKSMLRYFQIMLRIKDIMPGYLESQLANLINQTLPLLEKKITIIGDRNISQPSDLMAIEFRKHLIQYNIAFDRKHYIEWAIKD